MKFYTTRPLPKEGAYALLRRYHLAGNPCDVKQFFAMNKFGKDRALLHGVDYKLPVYIVKYNGESIRTTLNITDIDKARRIQAYNELLTRSKVRQTGYKESKILWVPYHELSCEDEHRDVLAEAPTPAKNAEPAVGAAQSGKYPIFGSRFSEVKRTDSSLKGKVFYVEGGHGGPDPGAMAKLGKRSICEDEYAYDISLRVARLLIQKGATVYIINRDPNDGIREAAFLPCDCDEKTYPNKKIPINQKARLNQRHEAINTLFETNKKKGIKDQRYITIHVESRGPSQRVDAFFYYRKGDKESRRIAENMQEVFKKRYTYRKYEGTIESRDLHMLRETKPDAIFVEVGNIRNKLDQERITKVNNRQALARWLVEGLIK